MGGSRSGEARFKRVLLDSKSCVIHYCGQWILQPDGVRYNISHYYGGGCKEYKEFDGDKLSLPEFNSDLEEIEPQLVGQRKVYKWLCDGVMQTVHNDNDLFTWWVECDLDGLGRLHLFVEMESGLLINVVELMGSDDDMEAIPTPTLNEPDINISVYSQSQPCNVRSGRLPMAVETDEIYTPTNVDELPEEILDPMPEMEDVASNIHEMPNELPVEHEYHSGNSESEDEYVKYVPDKRYDAFVDEVDNLYDDADYGEEDIHETHAEKLEVGMEWPTVFETRRFLRNYAIANQFVIKFEKNDPNRLLCVCKAKASECPWRLFASELPDGFTIQIKKLNDVHTCRRDTGEGNQMADSRWVAKVLGDVITNDIETFEPARIMKEIKVQYGVQRRKNKCCGV